MIEEVKKILRDSLPKYEEELKGANESPTGDWSGLDNLDGKVAQQLCQLFPKTKENPDGYEPKPDEGRLLTNLELIEMSAKYRHGDAFDLTGYAEEIVTKTEELTKILERAKCQERVDELSGVLQVLVDKYWCNQREDYNEGFIACITPEHIPEYWKRARQALKEGVK